MKHVVLLVWSMLRLGPAVRRRMPLVLPSAGRAATVMAGDLGYARHAHLAARR